MSNKMAKNYYFCTECKEKIDGDPYVQKHWSNINVVEFYHTSCFVRSHAAHLTPFAPDEGYCEHKWSFPPENCPVCNKRVPLLRLRR